MFKRMFLMVAVLFFTHTAFAATEILSPNAAGDETNEYYSQYPTGGAHWDKVDEVSPDDAATYLYTDISSFGAEVYNLPAHSVGSGTINYIKVYVRCKSDVLNYYKGYYRIYIKTNGTLVYTPDAVLATTYTTYSKQWSTNPVTGLAWTWAEIDALQIGESFAVSPYWAGHYAYCTQVYVEVDCSPAGIEYIPSAGYTIFPLFPNPASKDVKIDYTFASGAYVSIAVFDIAGKRVKTLVDGDRPFGSHSIYWDRKDNQGKKVMSGVYFIKLQSATGGASYSTKKVVLIR